MVIHGDSGCFPCHVLSDFSGLHGVHGRLDAQSAQGHGDRSTVVAVAQTHSRRGTAGRETRRSRTLLDGLPWLKRLKRTVFEAIETYCSPLRSS